MPQYYQEILASQLSPKKIHFLQLVLAALQILHEVKLEALAHAICVPSR